MRKHLHGSDRNVSIQRERVMELLGAFRGQHARCVIAI
jgi:hypothetical protein